ncbi:hypothetical protein SUDANB70_00249 [Streptomyces sp. enrichment culture]
MSGPGTAVGKTRRGGAGAVRSGLVVPDRTAPALCTAPGPTGAGGAPALGGRGGRLRPPGPQRLALPNPSALTWGITVLATR